MTMTRTLLFASAAIGAAMLPLGAASAADFRAAPAAFDWTGFYAGIHAGWLTGDVNVHEEEQNNPGGSISGHVWGFLAGTNFYYPPAAPWLLGLEGDFGWADVHGTGGTQLDSCPDYTYDLHWDAHLRLRASYPMSGLGGATAFIAGGLAIADLGITDACDSEKGGLFTGGTIGAGLDFNSSRNVMLRGEVLYDFYGRKQYTDFSADFTAWTARVAILWRFQ
jgi:outer membrane immunogenic protein